MASTTRATSKIGLIAGIKLSPREGRLVAVLQGARAFVSSYWLCTREFGALERKWPLNARKIITTSMGALDRKLVYEGASHQLSKRGNGGRSGIEYKLEKRRIP